MLEINESNPNSETIFGKKNDMIGSMVSTLSSGRRKLGASFLVLYYLCRDMVWYYGMVADKHPYRPHH